MVVEAKKCTLQAGEYSSTYHSASTTRTVRGWRWWCFVRRLRLPALCRCASTAQAAAERCRRRRIAQRLRWRRAARARDLREASGSKTVDLAPASWPTPQHTLAAVNDARTRRAFILYAIEPSSLRASRRTAVGCPHWSPQDDPPDPRRAAGGPDATIAADYETPRPDGGSRAAIAAKSRS